MRPSKGGHATSSTLHCDLNQNCQLAGDLLLFAAKKCPICHVNLEFACESEYACTKGRELSPRVRLLIFHVATPMPHTKCVFL